MTSPVVPRCTSMRVPQASPWRSCSASASGSRRAWPPPHNVPLTLLGAAMLWFGWFGFNAGSEGAVDGIAALAWINTLAAPAAATLGWLIVEKIKDGKPTSIGAASGAVAGLVAITPACNILTPGWGIVLGLIVGAICALAIELKFKLGFDDSLDVVGIHLVGGIVGTLYIGFFGIGIGLVDSGTFYQLFGAVRRCLRGRDLLVRPCLHRSAGSSRRRWASGSRTKTRSRASTPWCTAKRLRARNRLISHRSVRGVVSSEAAPRSVSADQRRPGPIVRP